MVTAPRAPIRISVINDYDLVVKGVASMGTPFHAWVEVVGLNANTPKDEPVDIGPYGAFGARKAH